MSGLAKMDDAWRTLQARAEKAERERDDEARGTVMGGPKENPIDRKKDSGHPHICGYIHTGSGCNPTKLVTRAEKAERELGDVRAMMQSLKCVKCRDAERERDEALATIERVKALVGLYRSRHWRRCRGNKHQPLYVDAYKWVADELDAALEGEKR